MFRMSYVLAVAPLLAAAKQPALECGTQPGAAQQEIFLHHRNLIKQARTPAPRATSAAINQDVGSIAVMDDSGGVVARRNPFDLDRKTLSFQPNGTGYRLSLGADTYDSAAASAGVRLNLTDDDTRQISLPFPFTYFGQTYRTAWVNSNGSVTFGRGDLDYTGSYGHFLAGPPVLAAAFTDLDPSIAAESDGVRVLTEAGRVVVSWSNVPLAGSSGYAIPPMETFQIRMYPDNHAEFTYRISNLPAATVGITPGGLAPATLAAFTSAPAGVLGPVAEVFSTIDALDVVYAAQKFYQTHDDAYDFLAFYNADSISAGSGVVAYELTTRSTGKGYGDTPTDLGQSFGSPRRLQAVLNMGPVGQYPLNPNAQVPSRFPSGDTPLTLLGHETGHLFLALVSVPNPYNPQDHPMLGRAQVHWAFTFNSAASFLEGNQIRDDGPGASPRFTTTGTVDQYAELDQYLMGYRAPEEVSPTFVVLGADQPESRAPQVGVGFGGIPMAVTANDIIQAAGRRTPDSTVAQRHYRMAIVLIVPAGSNLADGGTIQNAVAQVDRYRSEFEPFYVRATAGRAVMDTSIARSAGLSLAPAAGVVQGTTGIASFELPAPAPVPVTFSLKAPAGVVAVPATASLASGATRVTFAVYGVKAGVEEFSAVPSDTRYETAVARVQVSARGNLKIAAVSGDRQVATGSALAQPIVVRAVDQNALGYSSVSITAVSSAGTVTLQTAITDAFGYASFEWSPPAKGSSLNVSVDQVPASAITLYSLGPPSVSAVVNAASFLTHIAPNGFATVQGSGFAPGISVSASSPFPNTLGDVAVTLNGIAVPVSFVSDTQVNFLAPANLLPGSADLVVVTPAGTSAPAKVQIDGYAPGIFFDSATGYGAVLIAGTGDVTQVHPAKPGEYLEVYCTGLGTLAGQTVRATIGGLNAPVVYGGPTVIPGLYQVNVQVPLGTAAGPQALSLNVAGVDSNTVTIQIGN